MSANINKVVLIGDSGAGKSSVALRCMRNEFNPRGESTIGAAFFSKNISVPGSNETVKLNIWDCAGQERYRALSPMYLRGASYIILCVEANKLHPVAEFKKSIDQYHLLSYEQSEVVLCITKTDMVSSLYEDVREYAKEMVFELFLTSAKTGEGVTELFDFIATECHKRKDVLAETWVTKNAPIVVQRDFVDKVKPDCCD